MHNPLVPIKLGLALATLAMPAFSQDVFQTINLAGTVVADNKTGLSYEACLLYTSPSPRDVEESRMPSSA